MLKIRVQPFNLLPFFLVLLFITLPALPLVAQSSVPLIAYSETRSGIFTDDDVHRWQFIGESRDILNVRVQRISGQFIPSVSLLDAEGQELAIHTENVFDDTAELIFTAGLPADGQYFLQVSGTNLQSNPVDNPDEYSLTLLKTGQRKASVDEGLDMTLPDVMNTPIPEILIGTPATDNLLEIPIYSGAVLARPNPSTQPNHFVLMQGSQQVVIENASPSPVNPVLRGINFLAEGIGVVVTNDRLEGRSATFFTDQNFELAYDSPGRFWTFRLQSGQTIITDFDRIEAVLALENYVVVLFLPQENMLRQQAVFDEMFVNIRRRAVQPASEAPITEFRFADGRYLNTDLIGFDTLAYLAGQLRILYGADARFITDVVQIDSLLHDPVNPQFYAVVMQNPERNAPLTITFDLSGMGDIHIADSTITAAPLDGRRIREPLATTRSILIEQAGVRFERINDSPFVFRFSLPDGTEIETPAPAAGVDLALPHEAGYVPRGFNNLGTQPVSYCPCLTDTLENLPVNPANGNFHYAVTDFAIPSHTLSLNFTRYYNSLDAAGAAEALTPAYMLDAPQGYLLGQVGKGWRHSYQYELDITFAPLDSVMLILPDGARHLFTAPTSGGTRFTSRTLVAWVIDRIGGALGTWRATRTDGVQYQFDRAGRLERIVETPARSLTISPAPLSYAGENKGFFIVEPYGRRFEIYTNLAGKIDHVRDTLLREITYTYAGDYLTGVQYTHPDYTATYAYNEVELLETFDDVRSPYSRTGRLGYDERSRVTVYVENPGKNEHLQHYEYDDSGLITRRSQTVSEQERQWTWVYNVRWELTTKRPPGDNPPEEFSYNLSTGLLTGYTQPNRGAYGFRFDSRGNLIELDDPIYSDVYTLTYEQRGDYSLLTRLDYLNVGEEIFTYTHDPDSPPYLQSWQRLIQTGSSISGGAPRYQETRYEYDSWGRVVLMVAPGADTAAGVGTVYVYDDFGYPSEIWQGIIVTPQETRADITADRAQRILRFQYDLLGQLRAVTDGRGTLLTLNYDANTGLLRQITAPQGVYLSYQYDVRGNLIEQDDRGQITQYEYDEFDNLITAMDAIGASTHYQYDEVGNLTEIRDAVGRVTRYEYDVLDNLSRIISPGGLVTTFSVVEDTGDARTFRRAFMPDGSEILWRYDALNRLRYIEMNREGVTQDFSIDYTPVGFPNQIRSSFNRRTLNLDYNAAGWLTQTTIAGLTTRYEYDLAGNLIRVTTPGGSTTEITYDTLGNVIGVYPPNEDEITAEQVGLTLAYDAEGNLITSTDAAGLMTRYVYDALNQLVATTDTAGNETTYTYDVRGNLIRLIDPMGYERSWMYDALDRVITVNAGLYQSQYNYDAIGRLLSVTEPEGFTAQGRTLRLSYDVENNVIASNITPGQLRTLYTYDVLGRLTSTTDPNGHTTAYTYNRSDRLSQIIDALGYTQSYTWRNGSIESYTDAEDNTYRYSMDEFGRLQRIEDETGEMPAVKDTVFSYSPDGYLTEILIRPERVTNADDAVYYRYEYDRQGHLIGYIDPLGRAWHFEYDTAGQRIAMTDPAGNITRYAYNDSGRISQVTQYADTEQQTIEFYEYDRNGNITRYTSPAGIIHAYEYDAGNHLIQAALAAGTEVEAVYRFTYNGQGQLIQSDDPNNLRTCYFYRLDKLRRVEIRLTAEPTACDRAVSNEEKIQYSYEYDDADNLIRVTLPEVQGEAAVINLAYDALNRRVRYVDPTASVWSYTYDRIGNLRQISDPSGNSTEYEYNSYHQIIRVIFPTLAEVALAYDNNGNLNTLRLPLTEDEDSRQTLTYVLDKMGNLKEIREGTTLIRQYEYHASGQVSYRLDAERGVTCYEYDAAGQLIAMVYQSRLPCGNEAGSGVRYGYDVSGNLIHVQPVNGDPITLTYDALNRLKTFQQGGVLLTYEYDRVGNIIVRDAGEFGTTRYTYDKLYRLTGIQHGDASVTLAYDGRGQLTELARSNGVTTRYTYDAAGRVISLTHRNAENEPLDGFIYQYDGAGNLISADRVTDNWRILYSYDVMNRLIDERWLNSRGETVYTLNVRYDAAGNRTEVIRNGISTRYIYNDKNQLIEAQRTDETAALPVPQLIILVGTIGLFPALRRRVRSGMVLILLTGAALPLVAQTNPEILRAEYGYDAVGNLRTIDYVYIQPIIDTNGNPLIAPDGTPRTEETSYQLVFEYDAEQRLIAVTGQDEKGEPVAMRLDYDPIFSQPVTWFTGEDANYRLYYDSILPLAMDNTSQGNSTEQYLHLSPQVRLLTMTSRGEYIWHLNDVTNTPRRFVDNDGELLSTADRLLEFNSFGERIYPYPDDAFSAEAQIQQVMPLFAGQLFDPATGYYMTGLRMYDPETARFIQPDPVRQNIHGTLYTYAPPHPSVSQDSVGLSAEPYLQPTQILPFLAHLQPQSLIPEPYQPDIWLPVATTAAAQQDEFFRAWQLYNLTYYSVNENPMRLAWLMDDLYIANLHPPMPDAKDALAQNLRKVMAHYTPGQGWMTDLMPDPYTPHNPFALLHELEYLLPQTQNQPLIFCRYDNRVLNTSLMPQVELPSALSEKAQLENELLQALQPVSLLDHLLPEIEMLMQLSENALVSPPQLGEVLIPTVAVEPPLLTELEALYDQQQAFLERILNTELYPGN